MPVFSFDVTVSTNDLLKQGITEARLGDAIKRMYAGDSLGADHTHHRVVVEAPDRDTAALIACQMAGCHAMTTGCYDRI